MKEKYIDEKIGFYHIFGEAPSGVDISDGKRVVFSLIPREKADAICRAQHKFLEAVYKIMEHE